MLDQFSIGSRWYHGLTIVPGFWSSALYLALASLLINLFSLAVPITLMQVYDRIIANQTLSTLVWLVIGCVVALMLEGILRYARFYISSWVSARFEYLVGCAAFEKILSADLAAFKGDGLGVHLERLNAVSTLRGFYSGQIFQIILDIPFIFVFLVAIWFVGQELVLIPLGAMLIFLITTMIAKSRFHDSREDQLLIQNRRYNLLFEILGGMHLIKAQSLEEQMLRRHERLLSATAQSNMAVNTIGAIPINVGVFFGQLTLFGVLAYGASLVIDGRLTLGALAACSLLANKAFQPVQSVASFWLRFSEADIARNLLGKIAILPSFTKHDVPPFPEDIEGAVYLRDVDFKYHTAALPLFTNLNLVVEPNQMVGITSAGGGSTTLMYMILGLIRPDNGTVHVDDFDISLFDGRDLQGCVEYIPQEGVLFKGSILDNITMFNPSSTVAAYNAAALVKLDDLVALLPKGYETEVDSEASNFLSGGLIQRICIARALITRPRILIFDKVGMNMDVASQEILLELLARLKGLCTIFFITDSAKILKLADKVYRLKDGQIKERNTRGRTRKRRVSSEPLAGD